MSKGIKDESIWNDAKDEFKKSYDKEPEKDFEWAIVNKIYQNMGGEFNEDWSMDSGYMFTTTKMMKELEDEFFGFPMSTFHKGLQVEKGEHSDIDIMAIAQLVLDHLKEKPDYYNSEESYKDKLEELYKNVL